MSLILVSIGQFTKRQAHIKMHMKKSGILLKIPAAARKREKKVTKPDIIFFLLFVYTVCVFLGYKGNDFRKGSENETNNSGLCVSFSIAVSAKSLSQLTHSISYASRIA